MDEARQKRVNENIDTSGNNFIRFTSGFIFVFLYVLLWLIISSNFIYIINSKLYTRLFPFDVNSPPYSKGLKDVTPLFSKFAMNYGWPYNLKESNFLGEWFSTTIIGTWSKPRELLYTLFSHLSDIDERILLVFSPILFTLIVFLIPIIGIFSTLYGAFNFGENTDNHNIFGIIFSFILLLFGILWILSGITGSLQTLMFIIVVFIPLFIKPGRENIKNIINKHSKLISTLIGIFIIINAFANLQPSYGIGMLIPFIISLIYSFI